MTESTPQKQTASSKKGGAADTIKGLLIFLLLLVGAGSGGYFFGTYQKFAPIQYVEPGTPGAIDQTAATSAVATSSSAPSALKQHYWIKSLGYDHCGYAITVYVNNQLVDKFFAPGKQTEITKLVKSGENSIRFDAKALPASMNEHKGNDSYHFDLSIQSGKSLDSSTPSTLLDYKRNAAEEKDFDDTMTFVALE